MKQGVVSRLDGVADGLLASLGAALVVLVLVAVFCRYALNRSLSWSDEVVRYLFVWFTLLGGAVTLREREHIRVEYFVEKLPGRLRRVVEFTMLLGVCGLEIALCLLGALGVWYTARRLLRGEYAESDVTGAEPSENETGGEPCRS